MNAPGVRPLRGATVRLLLSSCCFTAPLLHAQSAASIVNAAPAAVPLPQAIPLWSGDAPGALGSTVDDIPAIIPFLLSAREGALPAVLVFPGGGYDHLSLDKEGMQVARWLNAIGVHAFVVRYRVGPRYRHPAMEQDGQRAMRFVRANAARFGVDSARVGVLGFSAGGHLAGLVATRFATAAAPPRDAVDRHSARPALLLLAYPVITLRGPVAHAGSRRHLLGEQPDTALVSALSLESRAHALMPPTFIVASTDDRSVPIENAVRFYDAVRAVGVPTELHVFESGRHGFGLAAADPNLSGWPAQAAQWLRKHSFLPTENRNAAATPVLVAPTSSGDRIDTTPKAIVDRRHAGLDGARVRGIPTYRTLNAALNAAPGASQTPWIIRLRAGRYAEKVSVDKPSIRLVGAHRDSTVITWADAAGHPERGGGTIGTRGSWTLRATVADFHASALTIENAFDFNGNARKADGDSSKLAGTQGVALALTERSDRVVLRDVVLRGHQDTFFANAGRAFISNSRIEGNVDFIFGNGRVVFEACDIVSLDRGSVDNNGYIAAPSTDVSSYGFLFVRSRLLKQHAGMAAASVALGRPWHPSADPRAVGQAVFVDTWMDDHISAAGWDRMSSTATVGGERIWFEPSAARFFEYRSTGPGARRSETRRLLSDGDARTYTPALFLDGWIPETRP